MPYCTDDSDSDDGGFSNLVQQKEGRNRFLIPFDERDGSVRLNSPADASKLKARVRHDFHEVALKRRRLKQAYDTGDIRTKEAVVEAAKAVDEELDDRVYKDANYRWLQWVSGHLGIDNPKKLLVGFRDSMSALRFHSEERDGVPWAVGEHNLCHNGTIQLSPTLVSARDAAHRKIMDTGFANPSMDHMVRERGINEIFARLTACLYRQIRQHNPVRYTSKLQQNAAVTDIRNVRYDLLRYLRSNPEQRRSKRETFEF